MDSGRGRKIFILGLDGGTLDLIRQWADQGELPNFTRLMKEGVSGTLRSTDPPLTPPAWTSSFTGKNPGKHNIFDFFKPEPMSYSRAIVSVRDRRSKALWNILSDCGKKVGVFNVPITFPPENVNGFVVTGMLTPSGESEFAYPPALKDELQRETDYRLEIDLRSLIKGDEERFLKGLSEGTENRRRALFYLIGKYEWDVMVAVFEALDVVQHFFWKFIDERHPGYGSGSPELRLAILDQYKQMDRLIGELTETISNEGTLLVYSDHGFGPLYKDVYIYNWLWERGFLNLKWDLAGVKCRLLKGRSLLPKGIRALMGKDHFGYSKSISAVDWSTTKAYFFSLPGQAIRVNLKGREPGGMVEEGGEYETVREDLIRELRELRDPETGKHVVEKVYRREEIYSGNFILNGPDLVVRMSEGYVLQEGFGEELMMPARQFGAIRSGDHHSEGVFFMKGKGIRRAGTITGADIKDVAPTVLYLMDIPVPRDLDGRILTEAFEPEYLKANPMAYGEETEMEEGADYEYTPEEREEVEKRLRSLKYIE